MEKEKIHLDVLIKQSPYKIKALFDSVGIADYSYYRIMNKQWNTSFTDEQKAAFANLLDTPVDSIIFHFSKLDE